MAVFYLMFGLKVLSEYRFERLILYFAVSILTFRVVTSNPFQMLLFNLLRRCMDDAQCYLVWKVSVGFAPFFWPAKTLRQSFRCRQVDVFGKRRKEGSPSQKCSTEPKKQTRLHVSWVFCVNWNLAAFSSSLICVNW